MHTPGQLRVLYLINTLGTGGAERSLVELLGPLRERGVELLPVVLHERAEGVGKELDGSLDVRMIDGGRLPAQARGLRELAHELDVDVLHTTLWDADIVGRLARPWLRIPLVCSLVATTYDANRLRFDPKLRRRKVRSLQLIDAVSSPVVDHFHAVTVAVADSAHQHLGIRRDRITVVPRGRDLRRLGVASDERRLRTRRALGLGEESVVLAVGRVEPQKGHRFLVDALPMVLHRDPTVMLLVAGRRGSASVDLEARVDELSLGDRVRFLGFRSDVPDLLVAADAFAFPSVYEGLGGALLEAMALETPIVASDIAPIREAVTADGALLVPTGDSAALAAALVEIREDPASARRRAAHARRRFEENYSLEAAADGMADMYRSVVVRRGGRFKTAGRRMLARSPVQSIALARAKDRLAVLAYHDVPNRQAFERHLELLQHERTVVSLEQVRRSLGGTPLPPRPVLITFDDGDRSLLENAAPALASRELPAAAFVVAGVVGTTTPFWWRTVETAVASGARSSVVDLPDEPGAAVATLKRVPDDVRRAAVSELANATPSEQQQLAPEDLRRLVELGVDVGSHSLTHPILDRCSDDVIEVEVQTSRQKLTSWLGAAPSAFAYPNGDQDQRVRDAVGRAGYELAFVFDHRLQSLPPSDGLQISRVRIDASDSVERLELVLSGLEPAIVRAAGRVT